jgi:peptidoglycan/LPS O-acetylase OafA/YrhL
VTAATHPGTYRPDIDGLRAVAVLLVLGFHAELQFFGAGFAGVDVFFVISGYLISRIVFRALAKGTFSFRDFYIRRINRIFPALVVVVVACLLVGWVVSMPTEYRLLGKHSFGGSVFASNIILWREAGYFDSPHKPLLHLWSLAVEEQFYLVWPPLALIAWRRNWNVARTITVVILSSLGVSAWMGYRGLTVESFYFAGTRLWEIGAGALLAQQQERNTTSRSVAVFERPRIREAAGFLGLVLLALTLLVVNHETPWPGLLALLPVLGSILIIATGPDTFIARKLLASRTLVLIGLISYPLYLWHWPLLVFARVVRGGPLSGMATAAVLGLSFVLAWLTYRYVESPIRLGIRKGRSAAMLLPALAAAGCAGLAIHTGIIPPRLYAAASQLDEARNDREGSPIGEGIDRDGRPVVDSIPGAPESSVVMIGDSHIRHYWPRVLRLSRDSAPRFPTVLMLRYGSCVPMPGVERRGAPSPLTRKAFECARFHQGAIDIAKAPRVNAVVYAAIWAEYLSDEVTFFDGENEPLRTKGSPTDRAFAHFASELRGLTDSGKRVYIVLDNPVDSAFDPVSMLPSRVPGFARRGAVTWVPRSRIEARSQAVNVRLREAARIGGATIIDPVDFLCGTSSCPTVSATGRPFYRDDNHMRASFVREKVTYIDRVFAID